MKRKIVSFCVIILSALVIIGTERAFAGTFTDKGYFTFEFYVSVRGTTKFNLENAETMCKSSASIYRAGCPLEDTHKYCVSLRNTSFLGKTYKGKLVVADGDNKTTDYGTITQGTYCVDIGTDEDLAPMGHEICGEGTIYQNLQ